MQCGQTTFENDMNGWIDKSDGKIAWIRSRGGNPETNTGPSIGIITTKTLTKWLVC